MGEGGGGEGGAPGLSQLAPKTSESTLSCKETEALCTTGEVLKALHSIPFLHDVYVVCLRRRTVRFFFVQLHDQSVLVVQKLLL